MSRKHTGTGLIHVVAYHVAIELGLRLLARALAWSRHVDAGLAEFGDVDDTRRGVS